MEKFGVHDSKNSELLQNIKKKQELSEIGINEEEAKKNAENIMNDNLNEMRKFD